MAEDGDTDYYETVEIHERDFQRYSIENKLYFVPIDIVSTLSIFTNQSVFYCRFGPMLLIQMSSRSTNNT
jgi:hypothetical protein